MLIMALSKASCTTSWNTAHALKKIQALQIYDVTFYGIVD